VSVEIGWTRDSGGFPDINQVINQAINQAINQVINQATIGSGR
tara:strand:- start:3 stop:131 length:129 start_codon:yes stop_codon:yes gene_type:complete